MITVNAMGDACPIPVVKTKKAIQALTGTEMIEVLVDNEIAVQNVMKLAQSEGAKPVSEKLGDKEYKITFEVKAGGETQETAEEEAVCIPDKKGNTVVVVSSDCMGSGNDELGHVLMKGFMFAVTQLDELPKTMLFYNGGARLTTEGSESLQDLKNLEAQGVEIQTCGTCLDFYGLMEKLQVGGVTNMYSIVETMNQAERIIRP